MFTTLIHILIKVTKRINARADKYWPLCIYVLHYLHNYTAKAVTLQVLPDTHNKNETLEQSMFLNIGCRECMTRCKLSFFHCYINIDRLALTNIAKKHLNFFTQYALWRTFCHHWTVCSPGGSPPLHPSLRSNCTLTRRKQITQETQYVSNNVQLVSLFTNSVIMKCRNADS